MEYALMNNVLKSIIVSFIILSCAAIFADEGTTTSSTVTTQTSGGSRNSNPNTSTTTTTTTTVNNINDDNIVSAIYAKYAKDSALIGTKLTVNSKNGIVTLEGTVTAQSQADEAVILAKSINGVKDVRSSINVITNPQGNLPPPQKPNY